MNLNYSNRYFSSSSNDDSSNSSTDDSNVIKNDGNAIEFQGTLTDNQEDVDSNTGDVVFEGTINDGGYNPDTDEAATDKDGNHHKKGGLFSKIKAALQQWSNDDYEEQLEDDVTP